MGRTHVRRGRSAQQVLAEALEPRRLLSNVILPVSDPRAAVFDNARGLLYITTGSGDLLRYDVAAGTFRSPLHIGDRLEGADVSPDGSTLYVGDELLANPPKGVLHEVRLDTGAVTDVPIPLTSIESGTASVAAMANGKVFVSTIEGYGQGATALVQVDAATNAVSRRYDLTSDGGDFISRSADRTLMAYTGQGLVTTYRASTDAALGTSGENTTGASVSRDGALVAAPMYFHDLAIIDPSFHVVRSLGISGATVAFDPSGNRLFTTIGHAVTAYDSVTWRPLYTLNVGTPKSGANSNWPVAVADDGRRLALVDQMNGAVIVADLPQPTGTAAKFDVSGVPAMVALGQPTSVTVTARDAAGNACPGYRGTVRFSSDDPRSVLPSDYTFTAADAGSHTFVVGFGGSATSLTVTDTALNASGRASGFIVQRLSGGGQLVPVPGRRSTVWDPVRRLLYISTSGGTIERYDPVAQTLLTPIVIGTPLEGMDITADGSTLIVADDDRSLAAGVLHRVDLNQGTVTTVSYPLVTGSPPLGNNLDGGSFDVAALSDGTALFSSSFDGSGDVPLRQLDLSTNVVTARRSPFSISQGDTINRSADRSIAVFGEDGGTGPLLDAYDATTGTVTQRPNPAEFADAAVSPDASLVFVSGDVFDHGLNLIRTVTGVATRGATFDPTRPRLYTINSDYNAIVAIDTNTWATLFSIPLQEPPVGTDNRIGSLGGGRLTVSGDGQWLFASTSLGVRAFSLVSRVAVTAPGNVAIAPGSTVPVTITARLPDGTVDYNFTGTVHLSCTDPVAGLPADLVFTAADLGVRTVNVVLNTPGSQAVTATDVETGMCTAAYDLTVSGIALAADGTLNVIGTDNADSAVLSLVAGNVTASLNTTTAAFAASSVRRVNVLLLGGNDTLTVGAGVPGGLADLGNGNDSVTANLGSDPLVSLVIKGGTGNDSAVMAMPASVGAGAEQVRFDGGNDIGDAATMIGTAGDDQIAITSAAVVIDGVTLTATGVQYLTVDAGAGNDNITASGLTPPVNYVILGNAGNDTINYTSGGGPVYFPSFAIFRPTVSGGPGDDHLIVTPQDLSTNAYVDFYGDSGNDTIDLNGATAGDRGSASGSAASYGPASIHYGSTEQLNLTGSAGADSLEVNASPYTTTAIKVDGSGGNDAFTFDSGPAAGQGPVVTLLGGDGNDSLTVPTNAAGDVSFDGGPGVDSVSFAAVLAKYPPPAGGTQTVFASDGDVHDGFKRVTNTGVESVGLVGSVNPDQFAVTPAPATSFQIDGGTPAPPSTLVDQLTVTPGGATGTRWTPSSTVGSGQYSFTNRQPITYTGIEALANLLPKASAGGPYAVAEAGSVTLNGGASVDADGSIVTYEWDLNYDGVTFTTDATGVSPTFSAAGIDGPASRVIALRVTDDRGGVSTIATATIIITNAPPAASFAGSTVTQGSAGTVTFSGQKDPSPADVAAGFKYSYDFNNDGTFDVVDSTSATAAVPASYLTTVGSHTVKGRIKDKDGGYTDYAATVTVNAPAGTGSIAGTVFNDANGNGLRDGIEGAMANVTLYLDTNKDGKYEAGEPTAVTGGTGAYAFKNLPGGVTYRVREVLPGGGYRVSSPGGGYFDVPLAAAQAVANENFADTRTVLFAGQVFNDANANGAKDATEAGVAGWTVYLDTNKNGVRDAGEPSTTTDAAGNYRFVLPPPSVATAYAARVVLPAGWRQTSPPGAAAQSATLSAGGSVTGRNFLATQKALIGGTVFADANGDGLRQSTEPGLAGWRVFIDANNDGIFESAERSVLTDASGNWSFTTLTAGTYVLRVVPQTGYARTTPTTGTPAGSCTVTVANGQVKTGFLFGERKIA